MSEEGKPMTDHPQGPTAGSSPAPSTPAPAAPTAISIEDFQKIALRVGVITAAEDHPKADRLLVLTVDVGDGDRKSTRLNSSHSDRSRMPSSA